MLSAFEALGLPLPNRQPCVARKLPAGGFMPPVGSALAILRDLRSVTQWHLSLTGVMALTSFAVVMALTPFMAVTSLTGFCRLGVGPLLISSLISHRKTPLKTPESRAVIGLQSF